MLIDRTAYRFVTTVAARIDPVGLERVRGEVTDAVGLFDERGWIDDPASYHRTPSMPTEVRERRRTSGRIRFTTLTWADGYEVRAEEPGAARYAGYERNRIARAALLEHRSGDRPWVLCVHGFGMGTHAVDLRAFRALHLHRDLGLNVAFVTLPLHGRRKPPGVRLAAMPGVDLLDTVHGMAQAVWDVRQVVSQLRQRGDRPVALLGMSLGSCVSAIVVPRRRRRRDAHGAGRRPRHADDRGGRAGSRRRDPHRSRRRTSTTRCASSPRSRRCS